MRDLFGRTLAFRASSSDWLCVRHRVKDVGPGSDCVASAGPFRVERGCRVSKQDADGR